MQSGQSRGSDNSSDASSRLDRPTHKERDTCLKPVKLEPEEEKSSGTDGVNDALVAFKIPKRPPPSKLEV